MYYKDILSYQYTLYTVCTHSTLSTHLYIVICEGATDYTYAMSWMCIVLYSLTHSLSHTHTHTHTRTFSLSHTHTHTHTVKTNLTRPVKIIRLEVLRALTTQTQQNPSYSNFLLPPQACITAKPSKCEEKNSKRQRERVPVPAVITLHVSNVSYDDTIL